MDVKEFDFKNFVYKGSSSKDLKKMPLTHLTHFYNIKSLIAEKKLEATYCKVFNKKLVYFFYGRPAYRIAKDKRTTRQLSFFPMCLLCDFSKMKQPNRIFPFDTGGFEYYKNFTHPQMKLNNFEIENTIEGIEKLINYFYENEFDYYDDKPSNKNLEDFSLAFEAASYYSMISDNSFSDSDQRNSTIEVQYDEDIPSKLFEVIIVPKQEETAVKHLLNHYKVNCEVNTYHTAGKTNPNDYYSEINKIVRNYIK